MERRALEIIANISIRSFSRPRESEPTPNVQVCILHQSIVGWLRHIEQVSVHVVLHDEP